MTRQATKKKHDKQRAEKKKHAHLTEQMTEQHKRRKRTEREEVVVIFILLAFVPFMLIGVFVWPSSSSTSKANTGLSDGKYLVTYVGSRPATGEDPAVAVLDVNGQNFFIDESDLSGKAEDNADAFFNAPSGESMQITVKNGYIESFVPTAVPQ